MAIVAGGGPPPTHRAYEREACRRLRSPARTLAGAYHSIRGVGSPAQARVVDRAHRLVVRRGPCNRPVTSVRLRLARLAGCVRETRSISLTHHRLEAHEGMIDQTRIQTAEPVELTRDERSMRLVEYAMVVMAVAAALLLSIH